MFDIKTSHVFDEVWTHIETFKTIDTICMVLYKKNILTLAYLSSVEFNFECCKKSKIILDHNIVSAFFTKNELFILDVVGNIISIQKSNSGDYSTLHVGVIPCENILKGCTLFKGTTLVCLSLDKNLDVFVQTYDMLSKKIRSCVLHDGNIDSEYCIVSINTEDPSLQDILHTNDKESIFIGCKDGRVILCSPDCSNSEVIYKCSEPVIHIFQLDQGLCFVQSDGCLIEYYQRVSLRYLPDSNPSSCQPVTADTLMYSTMINTFMYTFSESRSEKLRVKGVIGFSMLDSTIFALTLQGCVYILRDSNSEELLRKIQQIEELSKEQTKIDAELCALSMTKRANDLKCQFFTKLCILGGDVGSTYKFNLDLMHKSSGIVFDKDFWNVHISLEENNVMLPLTANMGCGNTQSLTFTFDVVPNCFLSFKVCLSSGPHCELKIPVTESMLTPLSFSYPIIFHESIPKLTTEYDVIINDEFSETNNILHRVLLDIKYKFTQNIWNEIVCQKFVYLKCAEHFLQLSFICVSKTLRVKCSDKELCHTIARIIKVYYLQTYSGAKLDSDFLYLNSIKQQLEIDKYESNVNMNATLEKLEALGFM